MDILTGYGICAGVGWLDIAAELAWGHHGVQYRTLAYCERDAYAQTVLASRMQESSLAPAAICDDMQDLVTAGISVDCIAAGFPCQDISVAGRGVGIRGARSGLWFEILDVAVRLGVRWLLLENVAAITHRGMDEVLGSLAEAGFDAEWMCLRASDVGATHRRDRWFCVAYARGCGLQEGWPESTRQQRTTEDCCGGDLGDTERNRRKADGTGERRATNTASRELFPPPPTGNWEAIPDHLRPAIEPGLRVLVDGSPLVVDTSRVDQLRCAGNGVVVIQAATAFARLIGLILQEKTQ